MNWWGRSSVREHILDLSTALVALLAVGLAGVFLWNQFGGRRAPLPIPMNDRELVDWRPLTASGHWMGSPEADVVIIEFGDYECPFCRKADRILLALRDSYPEEVAVVFRHFPHPGHPNALGAARLSECAEEQDYFESVHHFLFTVITLEDLDLEAFAEAAQIPDPSRFLRCMARTETPAQIAEDLLAGERLGIKAVPTFIVNGTILARPPDSAGWFELVDNHVNRG